jgi:hypothetical protein
MHDLAGARPRSERVSEGNQSIRYTVSYYELLL